MSRCHELCNSIVFGWDYDILISIIAQLLTSRPFPDLCSKISYFRPETIEFTYIITRLVTSRPLADLRRRWYSFTVPAAVVIRL